MLEMQRVHKSYPAPGGGEAVQVLEDLDLVVRAGEAVAVSGPSGSGKSTLLNLAAGLDRPSAGRVMVGGQDLADVDEAGLASLRSARIGLVFQLHHLLPQCTVLENVLLPTIPVSGHREPAVERQRALQLIERVGLGRRLEHRPGELSGGERQRAAVARALINDPALVLADEPTGALDGATAADLGELLLELHREHGVALVLCTHSWELARQMDRVLRLERGQLQPASPMP